MFFFFHFDSKGAKDRFNFFFVVAFSVFSCFFVGVHEVVFHGFFHFDSKSASHTVPVDVGYRSVQIFGISLFDGNRLEMFG